jgi:hypothetical protein
LTFKIPFDLLISVVEKSNNFCKRYDHLHNDQNNDNAVQPRDVVVVGVVAPHIEHGLDEHSAAVDQLGSVLQL